MLTIQATPITGRYNGSPSQKAVHLTVLYTSGVEVEWPDRLDPQTGIFTYYGDNREIRRDLVVEQSTVFPRVS